MVVFRKTVQCSSNSRAIIDFIDYHFTVNVDDKIYYCKVHSGSNRLLYSFLFNIPLRRAELFMELDKKRLRVLITALYLIDGKRQSLYSPTTKSLHGN